jgi:hypothetical protein
MDVTQRKRGWRDLCAVAIPELIISGFVGTHLVFQNAANIV